VTHEDEDAFLFINASGIGSKSHWSLKYW